MNRAYWQAASLLGMAALISSFLWLYGFPPEWDLDKGENVSAIRVFLTTPFSIVAVGTCLTVLAAFGKRDKLGTSGKTQRIALTSFLLIPVLTLFLQAIMPLLLYDVIGENGADLIFFLIPVSFFLIMGNYIVTAEYDSRIGLRNKWTLSDPIVWARTHRFFGRSLVTGALLTVPLALFIKSEYATYTLVGIAISLKFFAYLHARSLGQRLALRNT